MRGPIYVGETLCYIGRRHVPIRLDLVSDILSNSYQCFFVADSRGSHCAILLDLLTTLETLRRSLAESRESHTGEMKLDS
jgi:hypothetical protein